VIADGSDINLPTHAPIRTAPYPSNGTIYSRSSDRGTVTSPGDAAPDAIIPVLAPSDSKGRPLGVLKAAGVYAASSAVANGMRFLLLPLLARSLSQAEFGNYTVAITIVGFGTMLSTAGQDAAAARAWYDCPGVAEFRRVVSRSLLTISFLNAIWLAMVVAFGSSAVARFFPASGVGLSRLMPYIASVVFFFPFASVGTTALQSQMRPLAFGAVQVFRAAFVLVVVAVAAWMGTTSAPLVLMAETVALAVGGIGAVVAALSVRRPNENLAAETARSVTTVSRAFAYGLPMVPAGISNWAMAVSDRLVLARFVSPAAIAIYGLGYSLPMLFGFLLTAANTAYVPHFFGYAVKDAEHGTQLNKDSELYALTFGWLALSVALLAPELARLAGGTSYAGSAPITRIVVFALYLQGFYLLASLPLYQKHRTAYLPVVAALAAATNVVLNLILVPRYGIIAAAWDTLVAYSVLAGFVGLASRRLYPGRPINWLTVSLASGFGVLILLGSSLSAPLRAGFIAGAGLLVLIRCKSLVKNQTKDSWLT
jgi:O-antigen/teichoic acid export membrane protein